MEATCPEGIWVSDITYIGNRNRHMYLIKAYSKKIMEYGISSSLDTQSSLNEMLEYMHHQKKIKIISYKNKQFSKAGLAELFVFFVQ